MPNRFAGLRFIVALVVLAGTSMLLAAGSAGADGSKESPASQPVQRAGPLAGLPSPPGGHLAGIAALGDNAWLNLGPPAADPKFGSGRGRSWGCKMDYAPELRGAFIVGQSVHGFISPQGRYDDIFFYDLNAHRWVCVYPGLNTRTFVEDIRSGELRMSDDGQLVDKSGQPVFYAYGGHSYHSHTYDPDQHRWVTAVGASGLGGDQYAVQMAWHKEGAALLREQMTGRTDRVSGTLVFFDTVSGRFERPAREGTSKPPSGGVLFYLPTRKALWHYLSGATMLYDTATGKWSNAAAKGPTPPGSADLGACYDSKRDRLYLSRGGYGPPQRKDEGNVYIYDVRTNAWSNPANNDNAATFPATNYGCVHYDAAADRVVSFTRWEGKGGISIYDPQTGAWEGPLALPPAVVGDRSCVHGFYSPEVNAHFFHFAGDSSDRGTMWAYRYRRSPADPSASSSANAGRGPTTIQPPGDRP